MKISYLIFASLLCASLALAEPEPIRESFVSASAQFGSQSYQDYDLASKLALNNIWRFDLDLSSSKSESNTSSKALELGVDALATPSLDLTLNYLASSEPNNLRSSGFAPGADWTISDLWQAEKETILSIAFQSSSYSQSAAAATGNKVLTAKFRQNAVSLGLQQDLTRTLTAGGSYTSDSYNALNANATSLLGRNSTKAKIANSRLAGSTFNGLTDGLPSKSFTFSLNYRISDSWSTAGKYTHTKLALTNALVDEPELSVTYKATPAWEITLNTTYSKQQYEQAISAAGSTVSYNF